MQVFLGGPYENYLQQSLEVEKKTHFACFNLSSSIIPHAICPYQTQYSSTFVNTPPPMSD